MSGSICLLPTYAFIVLRGINSQAFSRTGAKLLLPATHISIRLFSHVSSAAPTGRMSVKFCMGNPSKSVNPKPTNVVYIYIYMYIYVYVWSCL
jgi:hypothetical protein